jgi:hypothetical protein
MLYLQYSLYSLNHIFKLYTLKYFQSIILPIAILFVILSTQGKIITFNGTIEAPKAYGAHHGPHKPKKGQTS